jgi:hypothetical protein
VAYGLFRSRETILQNSGAIKALIYSELLLGKLFQPG